MPVACVVTAPPTGGIGRLLVHGLAARWRHGGAAAGQAVVPAAHVVCVQGAVFRAVATRMGLLLARGVVRLPHVGVLVVVRVAGQRLPAVGGLGGIGSGVGRARVVFYPSQCAVGHQDGWVWSPA